MYTSEKDFPHGEPWWKENSKVLHKIFHLNGGRRGPPTKVSRWTPTSTNTQTTANVPLVWHRHTHVDPKKTMSWMGQSQRWDNPTMGQSHGTITPQWDYPNNDIDQPSWHLLKWDNMFINQSCQPPWQLRTLQSDKGEIILQDQMIGKNKKVAHFCPPLQRRRFIPIINHEKNHQKSALVQIPPANTVFRENIIHISTDQGRAKPWPMEKIYSQRTMFKSSKEINIKINHQVDKNACAPKNQHAYLTALGTKRASLAMLFVCGATLTLT